MTDKKFTDEQIIKALECCLKAKNDAECRKFGCPARLENGQCFYEEEFFSEEECLKQMLEDALSLINRQKAEIDRLAYDKQLSIDEGKAWHDQCKTTRAEAINEFAERLKKRYVVDTDSGLYGILDQIAKEMTEGQT